MTDLDLSGLPGAEWIERGLSDLVAGRESVASLLVTIAGTRLRRVGLPVPVAPFEEPELRMYRLLCDEHGAGAYSRYNSLLRLLDSFAHALEREASSRPR